MKRILAIDLAKGFVVLFIAPVHTVLLFAIVPTVASRPPENVLLENKLSVALINI